MYKMPPLHKKSKGRINAEAFLNLFKLVNSKVVKIDPLMRDSNNGFSFEMTAIKNGVISYGIPRIEKGTAILSKKKNIMNGKRTTGQVCSQCCAYCVLTECTCSPGSCLCTNATQYMTALSNSHVIKQSVKSDEIYIMILIGESYMS